MPGYVGLLGAGDRLRPGPVHIRPGASLSAQGTVSSSHSKRDHDQVPQEPAAVFAAARSRLLRRLVPDQEASEPEDQQCFRNAQGNPATEVRDLQDGEEQDPAGQRREAEDGAEAAQRLGDRQLIS